MQPDSNNRDKAAFGKAWNPEFDRYVRHFRSLQNPIERDLPGKASIKIVEAQVSAGSGFVRNAVHHITVPPNYRTSLPHAESIEEEFVYVLKDMKTLINEYEKSL